MLQLDPILMNAELVLQGGIIVTPHGQIQADLVVAEGRVAAWAAPGGSYDAEVVDATGLYVLPGGVDGHVHMQDPGLTEREDFITGTGAAAVGGVTSIVEHHRSLPFVLDSKILREKARYLSDRGLIDYALFGGVQPDNLEELRPMWEAGAAAFKLFTCNLHGVPAVLPDQMLEAFRECASFDGLCLVHAEDESIISSNENRLRAAGRKDYQVIPEWRTVEAEQVAVAATASLARITGCRVMIAHASHPAICDLVNQARQSGARMWVESCPQYFYLTTDEIEKWGPWHKFTPPARDQASIREMWNRLDVGDVDILSADHAPATREDKSRGLEDIWDCSFGLPGIETVLPLMLTGVNEGLLSIERLVAARSEVPAQVYGLWPRKGHLGIGADADLVLVDLEAQRTLRNDDVISKVGWTPFEGRKVTGLPVKTFVRGQLVAEGGMPVGNPGWGEFLPGPGSRT